MADWMTGINAYYNNMGRGFADNFGYRAQNVGETDAAGRPLWGEKVSRKEKLPWMQEEEEVSGDIVRRKEPGEECQTCKNRKYKDGSDENVSFKAAAHISPEAAAGRVRAHEGEHVANAYNKAAQEDGKVLSASVRIKTSICPECGKAYVSGGTTSTRIQYPAEHEREKEKEEDTV